MTKLLIRKCRDYLPVFLSCVVPMFTGISQAATVTPNQVLTGTNNWYRTNIYMLNGGVFVMSNAVLNIEAGTVIKGHNLGGQGTNVGALYITRGAKIFAQGTPQNPIIFTADIDNTDDPGDMDIWGPNARGHWGGVVLFGSAVINSAVNNSGDIANPRYEAFEGLDPDFTLNGQYVFRYGGSDDNDNSGVMRYVSIRHGGTVLAPNKELNGLSFAAVGRGTTIEFVEAYCAADDGFEFFGGTVNTKYLVSAFNDDDSFDTDMGYSGTNQFWFAIQAPDKRNYGMELNNQVNEQPQNVQRTPASDFKVYNMTIIGAGALDTTAPNGGEDAAVTLRPWVGPKIYNAIFTDFSGRGILLDTQNGVTATQAVTGGYAQFHNTLWWDFVTGSGNGIIDNTATNLGRNTVATNYWTDLSLSNQIINPLLTSISRTNVGAFLDPRPKSGSPAYSSYAATPNGFTSAGYQGAFGSGRSDWTSDWTALSEYSIVGGAGGFNPQPATGTIVVGPTQPILLPVRNGSNLDILLATQVGFSYQLQSTTNLLDVPINWVDENSPILGTGGTVTFTVPAAVDLKYFRVRTY